MQHLQAELASMRELQLRTQAADEVSAPQLTPQQQQQQQQQYEGQQGQQG